MSSAAKAGPDQNYYLCGHRCYIERAQGKIGYFVPGWEIDFSSAVFHSGEEPPFFDGGEI